jgi:hypothetical protein
MFGRGICEKYQSRDEKFPEPILRLNFPRHSARDIFRLSTGIFRKNTPPKHDISV